LWRKTKADCARGFQKCVDGGVELFCWRRLDWLQTFSAAPVASQFSCKSASGSIARGNARVGLETRERAKVFAREIRSVRNVGRVLSGWLCYICLRKQVCGLVKLMYVRNHWLKGPSPVSYPIGSRSTRIGSNPSQYIVWIKFKLWVPWSGQSMFQECTLWMLEDLCVHTDRVLSRVWKRKRSGVAIQFRDLKDQGSVRICVLPGCSIRMCTFLFRLQWDQTLATVEFGWFLSLIHYYFPSLHTHLLFHHLHLVWAKS
jgi:hypothetical protein